MKAQFIRAAIAGIFTLCILLLDPHAAAAQRRDENTLLRRRVVQLEDRVATLEQELTELRAMLRAQQPAGAEERFQLPRPRLENLENTQGWQNRENWRLLRQGLSQLEVRYLLGEPARVEVGDFASVWYYPDYGNVRFGAWSRRVEAWVEP